MATNLQFITTASGSGASSYSFTNFFSAEYDVYKLTKLLIMFRVVQIKRRIYNL